MKTTFRKLLWIFLALRSDPVGVRFAQPDCHSDPNPGAFEHTHPTACPLQPGFIRPLLPPTINPPPGYRILSAAAVTPCRWI